MTAVEIVRGERSGGATTSHTIVVSALQQLLAKVGKDARSDEYEKAVLENNVLGKGTIGSRRRTLRYLRELRDSPTSWYGPARPIATSDSRPPRR
jgi:hypothetical protein